MKGSHLDIITPARTRDLTTLQTVKEELQVADNLSDRRLARWIRESSAAIETYTRRIWAEETVVERFGGYRGDNWASSWVYPNRHSWGSHRQHCLVLARYPVTSIVSVSDGETILNPADYRLSREEGLLDRLSGGFPTGWYGGEIVVTYTAGYDLLDGLPAEVEQACLIIMKHRWSSRSRDPLLRQINVPGVQEETYWVGGVGENTAVPPEAAGLLAQHIDTRS